MDDDSGVEYADEIVTIRADRRQSYWEAAREIERRGTDAIWLQHEFGIFGGDAGEYILDLLEATDLPLVVTLHTVLDKPSEAEARVFERLLARADELVVMAEKGAETLRRRYGISSDRIMVIPHGVPDRPMIEPSRLKGSFDLDDRTVLMTFGLLAPDKGINLMIEAMPAIVASHPEVLYLVVGATHPNLLRHEGDRYRESLERRVEELGLQDHVRFHNAFVEQDELLDMLQASDIYITPYLNMAQVTSGTLSYAAAVGKPIVSTPYVHAAELLAGGKGVLVEPGNSKALADAVLELLGHPEKRLGIATKLYRACRSMVWPQVVERAVDAIAESRKRVHPQVLPLAERITRQLPLDALERMSDNTGIFQHSLYGVPDWNHGYCIDDNARALLLAVLREDSLEPGLRRMSHRYAAFVQGAWNPDLARFRNFMSFDRQWLEHEGSEDSNGRALWTLGVAGAIARDPAIRDWSRELYERATSAMAPLEPPRSQAFAALGAYHRLKHQPDHAASLRAIERVGVALDSLLETNARDGWRWYEPVLAYDNARLPEAHIRAGQALDRSDWIERGLETLAWLRDIQRGVHGQFRPVGHESFFREYQRPGVFDQQPVEAQAMVDAAATAFEATGDSAWIDTADSAYRWFVGDNDAGIPIAIPEEGSCYDGLMRHGVNRNQGAESILAFQLATVGIRALSLKAKVSTRAPLSV
jgi:glycosyltransferase involved in cell wall biosynthesis